MHRTNEDKARIVKLALGHPKIVEEFEKLQKINYVTIANHCGVSDNFVAKIWNELSVNDENSNRSSFQKNVNTKPSATAKILPEVRLLITGLELFDNPQELKALAFLVSCNGLNPPDTAQPLLPLAQLTANCHARTR